MSKVENELKEKIEEIIRQKAESSITDELSDSEHGYVDALIWLKEGSIQLTNEGIGKEIVERTYADKDSSKEYCDGYDSALKLVLRMLIELNPQPMVVMYRHLRFSAGNSPFFFCKKKIRNEILSQQSLGLR